ncbi:MAG: hypothetical protein V3S40_05000 [Kiloniellales bacterium]
MRIVIEQTDFKLLSPATQKELLETFAGGNVTIVRPNKPSNLLWRKPIDLTPDLAVRLLHGLSDPHRNRLRLFAKKSGRVTQKDLLAATKDTEMRVLSHFQAVLSRRLRRLINDPEKKAHLIGWDFESTIWNKDRTSIVNGVYYVTGQTTETLRDYFGIKNANRSGGA